jgi:RimJ/RimL family protein N-acetyltransferase
VSAPPDELATARLQLRRWRESDAEELRRLLDDNDAHLRPWIPFMKDEPRSLEATRERITTFVQSFDRGEHHRYAIRERTSGVLLGETMLLDRGGPGTREIGYWLDRAHCGLGFASEATAELPGLAFSCLGVERVILRCDERNAASLAVARRLHALPIGFEDLVENGRPVRLVVLERRRPLAAGPAC